MKKKICVVMLMTCLISVVSSMGVCYAEVESTAVVSYKTEYEELAPTDIKVVVSANTSEFGSIYDGDKLLGIGENIYQLKHKETRTFRLQPAIGYDVEKVVYDEEDITNRLRSTRSIRKNYLIEIEGKGHDAQLEVDFKKISTNEPDTPEFPDAPDAPREPDNPKMPIKPDTPSVPMIPSAFAMPSTFGMPSTGDSTPAKEYLALVCITGMVLIIFVYKKVRKR